MTENTNLTSIIFKLSGVLVTMAFFHLVAFTYSPYPATFEPSTINGIFHNAHYLIAETVSFFRCFLLTADFITLSLGFILIGIKLKHNV